MKKQDNQLVFTLVIVLVNVPGSCGLHNIYNVFYSFFDHYFPDDCNGYHFLE